MSRADIQAYQAEQVQVEKARRTKLFHGASIGLSCLALASVAFLLLKRPQPKAVPAAVEAPATAVPTKLQGYVDQAQKGDQAAMRMLGVCYLNGFDVKADRREALRWFRKAAAAGSEAAKAELKALGESL